MVSLQQTAPLGEELNTEPFEPIRRWTLWAGAWAKLAFGPLGAASLVSEVTSEVPDVEGHGASRRERNEGRTSKSAMASNLEAI